MARAWTKEEIEILKDNYTKLSGTELETLIGKTYSAIRAKAASLGISKKGTKDIPKSIDSRNWKESELGILKSTYSTKSKEAILSSLTDRTWYAIQAKASELGLHREKDSTWTHKELDILYKYYPTSSIEEYLKLLPNRNYNSIRMKATRLGITRLRGNWSKEEHHNLTTYYSSCTKEDLLLLFPYRSWESILSKANSLGLRRVMDSSWSTGEIDALVLKYSSIGPDKIKYYLPRSRSAIKIKANRLGLKLNSYLWSSEEEAILRKMYPLEPLSKILEALPNRSYYSINIKASKLQVRREIEGNSLQEKEVLNYIKSIYTGWIIENDRSILEGKELDIVLPDLGIAIEFNGIYWHSQKDKNYHLNKLLKVEDFGYRLISINETDWLNKQEIVKSRLNHFILGSKKIYARNCKIEEVSIEQAREFLNTNHIQGYANGNIRYGLFYKNNLVALMTFMKSRFNKNIQYELVRYCSSLGTGIIGGASKLLKHFEKHINPESLISYADRNYSSGNLYTKLGFTFSHASEPNYRYYSATKSYSRQQCMKHKLPKLFPTLYKEEMTEREIMKAARFYPVYDCGNLVFIKRYR